MSWREALNADIRRYFQLPDDTIIETTKTEKEWSGGCETCAFETFSTVVTYRLPGEATPRREQFYGDLAEFLNAVETYANENPAPTQT